MAKGRVGIAWNTLRHLWNAGGDTTASKYWDARHYFNPARQQTGGVWRPSRVHDLTEMFRERNFKKVDHFIDVISSKANLTPTQAQQVLTEYANDPLGTVAKYRKSNPDVAELLKAVPVEFASSANAAAKATLDASKKATKGFGKFMSDGKRARIAGKTLRWGAYTSPLTVGGATYLLWPGSENSEAAGDTAADQSRGNKPEEGEKPKKDKKTKKIW